MTVRAEAGELVLDGRRVPLLGGEMHFWRLDPGVWEACLRQLRAAGLPIVSTYLSWRRHSPAPGVFDLTGRTDPRLDLPAFLDICASLGLWVHLKPGPWICAEEPGGGYPDWLVADPEVVALDGGGRPVLGYNPPFQTPIPSCLHPRYLEHARAWLAAVDECVRAYCHPRGPIVMVQLDNEPSYTFHDRAFESDYHPVVVGPDGLYPRWLRARHRSPAALNAAHGAAHADFAAVEAPRGLPDGEVTHLGPYVDWVEFKGWQLARHIEMLRQMHAAGGVRDVLFTVNHNEHDPLGVPADWPALERASGLGGYDYYAVPPFAWRDVVNFALAANYGRAISGFAWAPEMMAGVWRIDGLAERHPTVGAADLEYLYFLALAFGVKGMNFYMAVDREHWEAAPVDEAGRITDIFAAVAKVTRFVAEVPDFSALRPVQPVALLYHRPDAREAYLAGDREVRAEGRLLGEGYRRFKRLFDALLRLGFDPAIVDPRATPPDRLGEHRMLIVAAEAPLDGPARGMLAEHVRRGGLVVTCGGRSAGAEVQSVPWAPSPATETSGPALRDELQALLAACGVRAPARDRSGGVLPVLHRGPESEVLFVVNAEPAPRTSVLEFDAAGPSRLVEVLSGRTAADVREGRAEIEIPGRSVRAYLVRGEAPRD